MLIVKQLTANWKLEKQIDSFNHEGVFDKQQTIAIKTGKKEKELFCFRVAIKVNSVEDQIVGGLGQASFTSGFLTDVWLVV